MSMHSRRTPHPTPTPMPTFAPDKPPVEAEVSLASELVVEASAALWSVALLAAAWKSGAESGEKDNKSPKTNLASAVKAPVNCVVVLSTAIAVASVIRPWQVLAPRLNVKPLLAHQSIAFFAIIIVVVAYNT